MSDTSNPTQLSLLDAQPAATPATPLDKAIAAWLEHRRREGLAANTLKAFGADVRILGEYLTPDTPIGQISTNQLNAFLAWMRSGRGRPCSDKTYDRRVTALKAFFRWATAAAGLAADPAAPVLNLSVRSPLPEILSEDEIARALAAAERIAVDPSALPPKKRGQRKPDLRPYMLLVLALHTGIRKSEAANLTRDELHLDAPEPHFYVRYSDTRHKHKSRRLPIPREWAARFEEYCEQHEVKERVFPWSVRRLEYLLADIVTVAGLRQTISFDKLRWTSAVRDHREGMSADVQRRKLGLSDVQWGEVQRKVRMLAGRQ